MAEKFNLNDTTPAAPGGRINIVWQSDTNGNVSAHIPPGSQTPWTQNIDAANYDLNNLGVVRLAQVTLGELDPGSGLVGFANEAGTLHAKTGSGGSIDLESIGNGRVQVSTDGARRIVVHQNGNVGIGPSMNPAYKADVQGDCNVSGVYRVNGAPLAFAPTVHTHAAADTTSGVFTTARLGSGTPTAATYLRGDGAWSASGALQTPWTSHIDAAGFELRNAGKIGVGVAPAVPLHVQDPTPKVRLSSGVATEDYDIYRDSADGILAVNGAQASFVGYKWLIQGAERMRIAANGNVGIGTAAPIAAIHAKVGTNKHLLVAQDMDWVVAGATGLNALNDAYSAQVPLALAGNPIVLTGGNVGIGSTLPAYKLDVAGDVGIGPTPRTGAIAVPQDGPTDSGAMTFSTRNLGAFAERVRIAADGSVGIGTASPGRRLVVTGPSEAFAGGATGIAHFSVGTAATNDDRVQFGVVDGAYSWIQAIKPGIATRNLVLNPNGGSVGIGALAPFNRLTVKSANSPYTDSSSGTAAIQIATGVGGQTDESLLFAVSDSGYSWIQAIKAGTAARNLVLQAFGGNVGIGSATPTSKLQVVGLPSYADNAAALAGGLTVGAFYHTAGVVKVVI
jgi:hypothetical protein